MNIHQNDQYYIKIAPKLNDVVVDDGCDEMVIKVGDIVLKKSLNQISYDSENKCWLYPLTIDQSSESSCKLLVECWFAYGDYYRATPVAEIDVINSTMEKSEVL